MKDILQDEDGWHVVLTHPQQHYFWKGVSLCTLFKSIPEGSYHDNNPLIHCSKCEQKVNRLMAVASSLPNRKLTMAEIFGLMENLEKVNWNKGTSTKVRTGENVTAVITHESGDKETVQNKKVKAK